MMSSSNSAPGNDPQLKNNLDQLKRFAEIIHTNARDGKELLENWGYNWLDGISEDQPDFFEEEVARVFYVAVNDVIHKKVKPVKPSGNNAVMELNEELLSHLVPGIKDLKMSHYFRNHDRIKQPLTSPRDLAEYLRDDVPLDLVENLIQHQFDIRWSTPDEAPAKYTFYDFCGRTNTTNYFKYDPRRAHVTATLYRECCRKPERPKQTWYGLLDKHKKSLCPKVYIKIDEGWMTWQPLEDGDKFSDGCVSLTDTWIDQSLQTFFNKHADVQKSDRKSLRKSLTQPTIYFVVIQDTDFPPPNADNKLELNEIGKNQVYVGKTMVGIRKRWINDSKSHCKMMEKCLKNVCAMTTYDPQSTKLEGIQLVDARLALAKVRGENTALFVVKIFDDLKKAESAIQAIKTSLDESQKEHNTKEKHDSTSGQKSVDMTSVKDDLRSPPSESGGSRRSEQADVPKQEEQPKKSNDKIDKLLKTAEQLYLKGNDQVAVGWKPTNMRYGMNYCDE